MEGYTQLRITNIPYEASAATVASFLESRGFQPVLVSFAGLRRGWARVGVPSAADAERMAEAAQRAGLWLAGRQLHVRPMAPARQVPLREEMPPEDREPQMFNASFFSVGHWAGGGSSAGPDPAAFVSTYAWPGPLGPLDAESAAPPAGPQPAFHFCAHRRTLAIECTPEGSRPLKLQLLFKDLTWKGGLSVCRLPAAAAGESPDSRAIDLQIVAALRRPPWVFRRKGDEDLRHYGGSRFDLDDFASGFSSLNLSKIFGVFQASSESAGSASMSASQPVRRTAASAPRAIWNEWRHAILPCPSDVWSYDLWERHSPTRFAGPRPASLQGAAAPRPSVGSAILLRVCVPDNASLRRFLRQASDFGLLRLPPHSTWQAVLQERLPPLAYAATRRVHATLPLWGAPSLRDVVGRSSLPFATVRTLEALLTWDILPEYLREPGQAEAFCAELVRAPEAVREVVLRRWYDDWMSIVDPIGQLRADVQLEAAARRNAAAAAAAYAAANGGGAAAAAARASRSGAEEHVLVARALVTPSRIYIEEASPEVGNRVVRHFGADPFLRVAFVDENLQPLNAWDLNDPAFAEDAVQAVLTSGIHIGGRRFEFLAFSSSQLMEGSVWMMAPITRGPDAGADADAVRAWMGDFSAERNIPKAAARMGQCFSTTVAQSDLLHEGVDWAMIDDVRTPDGKYNFSDGCGTCSHPMAAGLARRMGLPLGRPPPSGFQVRFAGFKGVVSIHEPGPGERHAHLPLRLRGSMRKFESPHTYLEIIRAATFSPGYLNRQIITLLFTLGVPSDRFLALQAAQVAKLDRALVDRETAQAVLLEAGGDLQGVGAQVAMLLRAGLLPGEPYVARVLRALRATQLANLRARARIRVPHAALLIGIMDEAGVLEYGQVYVRLQNPIDSGAGGGSEFGTVLEGPVSVAKNPCLHPGDMRLLTAVDRPELAHLANVVVFPQRGPRPHPSESSGSDLDGDVYFVCWEIDLAVPRAGMAVSERLDTCGYPPMDYTAPPAKHTTGPIGPPEFIEFFCGAMKANLIGPVANAHVAFADESPVGALDPRCIQLAALHSLAVDYPKTGVAPEIPRELKPTSFPDFMEKHDKPVRSTKGVPSSVLGTLWHALADDAIASASPAALCEAELQALITSAAATGGPAGAMPLQWPGMGEFLEAAMGTKQHYDNELAAIMNRFGARGTSEGEIVSGHVLKFHRRVCRNQRKTEDAQQHLTAAMRRLRASFRAIFWEDLPSLPESEPQPGSPAATARGPAARRRARSAMPAWEELLDEGDRSRVLAKAAAWYSVTYQAATNQHAARQSARLVSFPYVVADVLAVLVRQRYRSIM